MCRTKRVCSFVVSFLVLVLLIFTLTSPVLADDGRGHSGWTCQVTKGWGASGGLCSTGGVGFGPWSCGVTTCVGPAYSNRIGGVGVSTGIGCGYNKGPSAYWPYGVAGVGGSVGVGGGYGYGYSYYCYPHR